MGKYRNFFGSIFELGLKCAGELQNTLLLWVVVGHCEVFLGGSGLLSIV